MLCLKLHVLNSKRKFYQYRKMNNTDLIRFLKANVNNYSREQLSQIIELASKAYIDSQPFLSEQEVAEKTLDDFIEQVRKSDKESIMKVKKRVSDLIP